eukprot:119730_1
MSSFVDIVSFIDIAFLLLLGLICICWVFSFYLLRTVSDIAMRRPQSSIFIGILCIIGLTISFPYVIFISNISSMPDHPHKGETTSIILLINVVGLYHVFSFRSFRVYFDIKWQQALDDQKWRLHIDPNEKNWFLRNKHSWGSAKRLGFIFLTHLFFWAFFAFIVVSVHGPNAKRHISWVFGASGILPTIFDIIMYIKFPKFKDVFNITQEIKYTLTLEIFVMIVMPIIWFLSNPTFHTISFLFYTNLSPICLFIYVFLIHYRPLHASKLPTNPVAAMKYISYNNQLNSMNILQPESPIGSSSTGTNLNAQEVVSNMQTMRLQHVISHEIGFNLFARHLTKEWSIECLLFLLETSQWLLSISFSDEIINDIPFILPSNAPISKIVQMDKNNEYIQCAKLFTKYISNDAYFAINIASKTRHELYQQTGYNDKDKQSNEMIAQYLNENGINHSELMSLFSESRKEIYRLIHAAFGRFRQSDTFQKLSAEMFPNK